MRASPRSISPEPLLPQCSLGSNSFSLLRAKSRPWLRQFDSPRQTAVWLPEASAGHTNSYCLPRHGSLPCSPARMSMAKFDSVLQDVHSARRQRQAFSSPRSGLGPGSTVVPLSPTAPLLELLPSANAGNGAPAAGAASKALADSANPTSPKFDHLDFGPHNGRCRSGSPMSPLSARSCFGGELSSRHFGKKRFPQHFTTSLVADVERELGADRTKPISAGSTYRSPSPLQSARPHGRRNCAIRKNAHTHDWYHTKPSFSSRVPAAIPMARAGVGDLLTSC